MNHRSAFTLIELLVVIAIIAILSVVVILTLNPAQIIESGRDANRISDMGTMTSALGLYLAEGGTSLGSSNVVYVSIPDQTATSTAGDQCQGLGLISLPSTYSYHCAASSTFRSVNGTGWIPINFSSISAGSPLGNLPVDPINQSSSRLYYTYDTNGSQYEVTSVMESSKYQLGGSNDVISNDGGTLASVYEKGSGFGLEPLDHGDTSLVGYWSFNEGTGTIAYDYSGNNATGSWNGTQVGTNGYYSVGKVGAWAGTFDGSTDYIAATSSFTVLSAVSLSAWVNASSLSSRSFMVRLGEIDLEDSGGTLELNQIGVGAGCSASFSVTGSWAFLAGTWDGVNCRIYINGALASGPSAFSYTISGTLINIGGCLGVAGLTCPGGGGLPVDFLTGKIDDVRVYNRALSAAQIAAMYAGGK